MRQLPQLWTQATEEEAISYSEHHEDAIVLCRRSDLKPDLGRVCLEYVHLLVERNIEGDQEKAISLLDEILKISRELGTNPLMERVLSRREILTA